MNQDASSLDFPFDKFIELIEKLNKVFAFVIEHSVYDMVDVKIRGI
jgi:hypothetical protein